jgi:hypothetical protein
MHSNLMAPIMALVLWTFVMCAWLYGTRIPAMIRLKVAYDPTKPVQVFQERTRLL